MAKAMPEPIPGPMSVQCSVLLSKHTFAFRP